MSLLGLCHREPLCSVGTLATVGDSCDSYVAGRLARVPVSGASSVLGGFWTSTRSSPYGFSVMGSCPRGRCVSSAAVMRVSPPWSISGPSPQPQHNDPEFLAVAPGMGRSRTVAPVSASCLPSSVSVCVCLCPPHARPVLCPSVHFSDVWIPESFQGKSQEDEGREEGRAGDPEPEGGGGGGGSPRPPTAPLCPDGLPGFCPSSAQHRGGRFLGGDRERPHGLVSG